MRDATVVSEVLTAEDMHAQRNERNHEQHCDCETIDVSADADVGLAIAIPGHRPFEGWTKRCFALFGRDSETAYDTDRLQRLFVGYLTLACHFTLTRPCRLRLTFDGMGDGNGRSLLPLHDGTSSEHELQRNHRNGDVGGGTLDVDPLCQEQNRPEPDERQHREPPRKRQQEPVGHLLRGLPRGDNRIDSSEHAHPFISDKPPRSTFRRLR